MILIFVWPFFSSFWFLALMFLCQNGKKPEFLFVQWFFFWWFFLFSFGQPNRKKNDKNNTHTSGNFQWEIQIHNNKMMFVCFWNCIFCFSLVFLFGYFPKQAKDLGMLLLLLLLYNFIFISVYHWSFCFSFFWGGFLTDSFQNHWVNVFIQSVDQI